MSVARWRAAALVVPLVLSGCAAGATSTAGETRYVAGAGVVQVVAQQDRRPAPDLEGPLLGGGELSIASLRGRVVALNVWGSWCPPCRKEAPALERVFVQLRPQGFELVGVNTRDTEVGAAAFVAEFGITYPSIVDPDGRLMLPFAATLPPAAIRARWSWTGRAGWLPG